MPLLLVGGGKGWRNRIQIVVPPVARVGRVMSVMHRLMVLLAVVLLRAV